MKNKWLAILNPNAGGGSAKHEWPKIELELIKQKLAFEKIETKYSSISPLATKKVNIE